jgi:hypothetical protein
MQLVLRSSVILNSGLLPARFASGAPQISVKGF